MLCLEENTVVLGMEVVPGDAGKHGSNATVVWVLSSLLGNGTQLVAYDGYDQAAPVLLTIPLPPTDDNATVSAFTIRNNLMQLLYTDGIVRRVKLVPATGLPTAGHSGSTPVVGFNLTAVANMTDRWNKQVTFKHVTGR